MPSIGNVVVKRVIKHKLLPPVYERIVKGPTHVLEQSQPIPHLVTPSIIGAGGESPKPHREVFKFITQSLAINDAVVKIKTSGVVGISYTQTSFTFESYTISGNAVTKALATQSTTITELLTVRKATKRLLIETAATQLSETTTIRRTKTRALAETRSISDSVSVAAPTLRTLVETQPLSDSVVAVKTKARALVQTTATDDNVAMLLPGIRMNLIETIAILEDLQAEVTHAGGTNIFKSLSESITLSELIAKALRKYRSIAETIALADNVIKLIVTTRKSFTSSFTPISFTSTARAEKILTESVGESHTLRMALTKFRSVPIQSVSITESVNAIVTEGRAADIVPITEEVVRSVGTSKQLGDTIIVSDSVTSGRADVVVISDGVVRVVGRNRSITQSVTIIG